MSEFSSLPHSGHDYEELANRWQKLANDLSLSLDTLFEANEKPVFCLENQSGKETGGNLPFYISAGVHGDECAPVWALLHWAETMGERLRDLDFLLFPCLNPHGLIENTRLDGEGRDLNRLFQDASIPIIESWQSKISVKKFSRVLNLHEDYDARGIYLYELSHHKGGGESLLKKPAQTIPIDQRSVIDDQPFENGIRHHEGEGLHQVVEEQLGGGYPEAIYLFLNHCENCITFETPSELGLGKRVEAHFRAIEAVVLGIE